VPSRHGAASAFSLHKCEVFQVLAPNAFIEKSFDLGELLQLGPVVTSSGNVEQHGDRLADLSERSAADVATNFENATR
jgi:hypothetical protein